MVTFNHLSSFHCGFPPVPCYWKCNFGLVGSPCTFVCVWVVWSGVVGVIHIRRVVVLIRQLLAPDGVSGLPNGGRLSQLVNANNNSVWVFIEGIQIPPTHMVRPLKGMAQSQSTHPPIDQDAGRLCFRMYMCTSLFFFGVLAWRLQWESRPQSLVIAMFEMLSEFCRALPGSFDLYLGEGVSIG
eukprot:1775425-Pyramimonas_sp.AAC.1